MQYHTALHSESLEILQFVCMNISICTHGVCAHGFAGIFTCISFICIAIDVCIHLSEQNPRILLLLGAHLPHCRHSGVYLV